MIVPKPIIKKQTISADVEFEAGDKVRSKTSGNILVVVYVDNNHVALLDHHNWSVVDAVMNVSWKSVVDNQYLRKYILGSDLAKAWYGGHGTLSDLLNEFRFEGSSKLQDAIDDLPTDDNDNNKK